MSTTYPVAKDAVRTTVVSYTLASGSITVASAANFPTPTTTAPILLTVITAATYGQFPETFATYQATGVSTNTLTGLTLIDGVDTAWQLGDIVEMRTCALHLNGPATAVKASILTEAPETNLPNSRRLTQGPGIALADGGAGSNLAINLAMFNPTAVKTGAYNAAANDFVPVDATSGSVAITLPTAPADKTLVGVKLIATATTNVATVVTGGSDVFNKTSGSVSLTLNGNNQSLFVQYTSASGIWYVIAGDNGPASYSAGTGISITTSGGSRVIAATGGGSGVPSVTAVLTSGTYTVPTASTFIRMVGQAPGGGGGGGGVGTASMFGGSGGGSGCPFDVTYRTADLPSTLSANIGALSTGGTAGISAGGNGGNASASGNTSVTNGATTYAIATGGGAGHGGTTSSPAGGNPGSQGMFPGQTGAGSSITAAGGNGGETNNAFVPGSGGGGSGITSGGASSGAGGNGGFTVALALAQVAAGGTTGGGAGGVGVAPYAAITNTVLGGGGGAGGGANAAGVGGAGGAGASYGAGGGGGGASVTGQGGGGAGGNGGPGIVMFFAW